MLTLIATTLLASSLPQAAQGNPPPDAPIGQETVITFVGPGGLRDWRLAPDDPTVLFVRDRRERWYRVTLSGPCGLQRRWLDTLSYTTDPNGTFDQFSEIRFGSFPAQVCRVKSIVTSFPPPGEPGARQHR